MAVKTASKQRVEKAEIMHMSRKRSSRNCVWAHILEMVTKWRQMHGRAVKKKTEAWFLVNKRKVQ